jgi:hypothetical protein
VATAAAAFRRRSRHGFRRRRRLTVAFHRDATAFAIRQQTDADLVARRLTLLVIAARAAKAAPQQFGWPFRFTGAPSMIAGFTLFAILVVSALLAIFRV